MTALTHPQEVAQMPFIWGNIYATPPGDYNSFKSHSLYIKNMEGSVSQGVVSIAEIILREIHPSGSPILPKSKDALLILPQGDIRHADGELVAGMSPFLNAEKAMKRLCYCIEKS